MLVLTIHNNSHDEEYIELTGALTGQIRLCGVQSESRVRIGLEFPKEVRIDRKTVKKKSSNDDK